MTKYIFVVGGVMSSVGKGIAAASIGKILQFKGFKVSAIKIDPYINVDAGTMNPIEHGEVFVTEDGAETDQDLSNYERFLDEYIYSDNYMTTGRVYQTVINKERNLEYGGKCVEVVPHIPEEIIRRINNARDKSGADIMIIEIGGTVGEYQNLLFLEAARMMKLRNYKDVAFVLVSYLPIPSKVGEMKTKPTQYAARTLNSAGIQADFILCRAERALDDIRKQKLATNCNMFADNIISAPDVESVYEVPLNFEKEKLAEKILKTLELEPKKEVGSESWANLVKTIETATEKVRIGIVGKYFQTGDFVMKDSYISVLESIKHAAWKLNKKPDIVWINSEVYEQHPERINELDAFDGVIVPGGFGTRGVEGKISAIQYCREKKIPYFGLCYGMQLAVIEYSRHVCGISGATTCEMDPNSAFKVIDLMPEQLKNMTDGRYGGTMRLGAYPCIVKEGTKAFEAYKSTEISERHRHRYEVNNDYREQLEKAGMVFSGVSPDGHLVEMSELPEHPFFLGVQFHPEFKSRPLEGHPLFNLFIEVCVRENKSAGYKDRFKQ